MKMIVAGGRDYNNEAHVFCVLDDIYKVHNIRISEVVCGMAQGADLLGFKWALKNEIPVKEFQPNWKEYGPAAGPIRNRQMAEYADGLVAFWDNRSKGTADMITQAGMRGLRLFVHSYIY